jgi:hypothetical protein
MGPPTPLAIVPSTRKLQGEATHVIRVSARGFSDTSIVVTVPSVARKVTASLRRVGALYGLPCFLTIEAKGGSFGKAESVIRAAAAVSDSFRMLGRTRASNTAPIEDIWAQEFWVRVADPAALDQLVADLGALEEQDGQSFTTRVSRIYIPWFATSPRPAVEITVSGKIAPGSILFEGRDGELIPRDVDDSGAFGYRDSYDRNRPYHYYAALTGGIFGYIRLDVGAGRQDNINEAEFLARTGVTKAALDTEAAAR